MKEIGKFTFVLAVAAALACFPARAQQSALPISRIQEAINADYQALESLYRTLHANPEISFQEARTAARLAADMRQSGYDVTEKVGGHGIVCILRNGDGPKVMIRTDMDALPVTEQTGLEYASKVQIRDAEGRTVGVMHACGHDMHMACWMGVARVMQQLKDQWSGTLIFIGQPAEERGGGAKQMLKDGLFERFPKPDVALALHCDAFIAHGQIGYTVGMALANVDSVDITVRGKGGHGSAPHTTIDPIVIAARIIVDLQTLVSRELDPLDSGVVTVGSIHGGAKHNIIPAEVKLQLTVRSFKDSTRKHLLDGIKRIANAAAQSARAPDPIVVVDESDFTPAMYNEPKLTQKTVEALRKVFGEENIVEKQPVMGGEDFSMYGRAGVPICLFRLGTIDPQRVKRASQGEELLPSLHSDKYAPVPEPSIKSGVLGMSIAVMNIVAKK